MGVERFGFGGIGFAILMFGRSGLTDGVPALLLSQRDDFGGSVGLGRRPLRHFTHDRFGEVL
jgi:hypothetical protein